jgi:hypothetical protein
LDWLERFALDEDRLLLLDRDLRAERVDPLLEREPAALEGELPDFFREFPERDPEVARAM